MLTSITTRFISLATAPESLLALSSAANKYAMMPKGLLVQITIIESPQAYGYRCNFHPGVFQGIEATGNVCALMKNQDRPWTREDMVIV
jgi:hypothetical protein